VGGAQLDDMRIDVGDRADRERHLSLDAAALAGHNAPELAIDVHLRIAQRIGDRPVDRHVIRVLDRDVDFGIAGPALQVEPAAVLVTGAQRHLLPRAGGMQVQRGG